MTYLQLTTFILYISFYLDSRAVNDVGLPPCIASVVLGDMELPRPHAFTSYRDDVSDFEFDPHGDEFVDHEMHEIEDENSSMQTDDTAVEVKSEPRNLSRYLSIPTFVQRYMTEIYRCLASGPTEMFRKDGGSTRRRCSHVRSRMSMTTVRLFKCICITRWESVLYWLYTGVIAFAPLSSAGKQKRDEFIQEYLTANPGRPIPTSCKSIYRLADDVSQNARLRKKIVNKSIPQLNLGSLKRRALQHLESQLTAETNLHELFSDFTSK